MSKLTRQSDSTPPSKNFRLDKHNGKLMGVSAGIANYTGVDPMLIRIAFVIGALVSFGTAALIYIAIGLIAD
jgi:phage shock protein PspC (stress-responsive transcriptional regulator)